MTGGFRYWAGPRTIRLPPWPGKVPGTAGDERTALDVALYVGLLASLSWHRGARSQDSSVGRAIGANKGLVPTAR